MTRIRIASSLAILLLATARTTTAQDAPALESWPAARASEALDASVRSGPGYRVRESGQTDAFLTTWEMESDYGLFVCPSTRLLEVRVREVAAMKTLATSAPDDQFVQGLNARIADVPTSLVRVVENPGGAVSGVAEGAKRTLGRIGDVFGGRKSSKYEEGGADSMLFAAEKRKVAAELGVDVYSTNSKLQTMLDEIAKARRAGGFAVDLGKMAIPGAAGTAVSGLSMSADMTSLLRDRTPAELDRIAEEKMAKAGVPPQQRRAFLADPWLSPRHRTSIAEAASRLAGVSNVGALIAAAAESQTEAQALLHEVQAAYLARLHAGPDRIVSLDVAGGVVAAFTASGAMHVPVPVDVIALVPEVGVAVDALLAMAGAASAPRRVVWTTGGATTRAVEYLRSRGLEVVQNGRLAPDAGVR